MNLEETKERSWGEETARRVLHWREALFQPDRGNIHVETATLWRVSQRKTIDNSHFQARCAQVCTPSWRLARSLSTTAIPTAWVFSLSLSLSLSLFPVAPVRNVTNTRRVSELRWSVAPNLSRPHFTGNENTKRDNATCLRTSIFTPRFSSTVVDLPFSRHRLVVSSSTFFFFPIFFFLFPSFFFFFFFFFLYINLVTLLFLAATRSLNPSPRFF